MTEMLVAVRDGVREAVAPLYILTVQPPRRYTEMPTFPRPGYLPDVTLDPEKALAKGRAQVAALAARYPRNMRTRKAEGS
jgi:hypothetical protein